MEKQGDALDGDELCARHRVPEAGPLRNALTTVNIVNIRGLNGAGRPPSWRRAHFSDCSLFAHAAHPAPG